MRDFKYTGAPGYTLGTTDFEWVELNEKRIKWYEKKDEKNKKKRFDRKKQMSSNK